MMKKAIFLVIVPLLIGILLIPAFSQEDMEVVDDAGFAKKMRPPAVFQHDAHNEKAQIEECNECHHVYENGEKLEDESSEGQSCSECHDKNDKGKQPGLEKAFHINCKGCHRQNKKGPVTCGKCHVR
jgi:hypothetical protein